MIINLINEFRKENNRERIVCWHPAENDYCLQHCLHMARIDRLEHTAGYFLKNKVEAIALCSFYLDINTTLRNLIFSILNESYEHKAVLLDHTNLAYGVFIDNNKVFLTVRGWN